jgi:hypothetical protein
MPPSPPKNKSLFLSNGPKCHLRFTFPRLNPSKILFIENPAIKFRYQFVSRVGQNRSSLD